jgi:hypothetical protein
MGILIPVEKKIKERRPTIQHLSIFYGIGITCMFELMVISCKLFCENNGTIIICPINSSKTSLNNTKTTQ